MPCLWSCELCSKPFHRKGDLKRHEKLHTGEKPHVCPECGKAFAQFTGLKTHRNVHTGDKPHHCNVCGARFGDPSSCARHKRETHTHPEGYHCFHPGCRTKIKRRSAFVKHLKAKHGVDIDLTKTSIEEAAAATDLLSVPPEAKKAATPPPDYTTAAKQRRYQEEDLPAFPPDAVPKLEVVTPPPAVIDVVPSSEGFCWSSAGLIDHTTLGSGVVCGSPHLTLLADSHHHSQPPMQEVNCFFFPDISQQLPSYYEQQPWTRIHSVAPADIFTSSPSPCASGTDYNLTSYDPNICGDFNSQLSSLRDGTDMHSYMTPTHMTSLPSYHYA